MVPAVPAFGGVPGGPELLILLVVLVFLFGVPLAAIAGLVLFFKLGSDDETAAGGESASSDAGGRSTARGTPARASGTDPARDRRRRTTSRRVGQSSAQ